MKKLSLLLALLLLAALALRGPRSVNAFQNPPDCSFTVQFTAAGVQSPTQFNKSTLSGGSAGCVEWHVNYSTTGTVTGLSLQIEGTNDVAGNSGVYTQGSHPGTSYTALQPVATSANPATGTSQGNIIIGNDYYPWVRLNLGTLTATNGVVTVRVYGYKAPPQHAGSGGGGTGNLTGTLTPGFLPVADAAHNLVDSVFFMPGSANGYGFIQGSAAELDFTPDGVKFGGVFQDNSGDGFGMYSNLGGLLRFDIGGTAFNVTSSEGGQELWFPHAMFLYPDGFPNGLSELVTTAGLPPFDGSLDQTTLILGAKADGATNYSNPEFRLAAWNGTTLTSGQSLGFECIDVAGVCSLSNADTGYYGQDYITGRAIWTLGYGVPNVFAFGTGLNVFSRAGLTSATFVNADYYVYSDLCNSVTSPAACAANSAGYSAIPTGGTTLVVNTSKVGPNSMIVATADTTLGSLLGITCNATPQAVSITGRVNSTSFTVSVPLAPVGTKLCFSFQIINF